MSRVFALFGWTIVLVTILGASGCTGGNTPSNQNPPASVSPPAPPSPPGAAPPGPPAQSVSAGPSAKEVPSWAGQRSDEPFDVKAYLASRAAPTDNAAPLYQAALASLSGEFGDPNAAALEQEIGALANVDKLVAGTVSAQQVDQVLARAAPGIGQIDAAQAKPRSVFVTGLGLDALLPHAQGARTVTRLSVLQLQQARTKGDFAVADAAVSRSLRMSRDLQPRGPIVCQLVSIAMDSMLLTAVERITLTSPQLTAEQCDRLLAALIRHQQDSLLRTDEGLKLEYIASRNTIADVQSGRLTLHQVFSLSGSEGTNHPVASLSAAALNYEREVERCNRLFSLLLVDANKPTARAATLSQFRQEMAQLRGEIEKHAAGGASAAPLNSPAFLCHFLVVAVEPFFDANRRITAQLAGTQMLLALRRFEIAHGSLPANLQTAASESDLKTVPLDPYDGAPLRFAMVGGKPTVYSVGKDLKDDGGQADWKFGQQPGDYLFVLPPRAP